VPSVLKSKDAWTQVKCNIGFDVCSFKVRNLTKGVKEGCANTGPRYQFKCAILLTEIILVITRSSRWN
jgi:hypothetical protein